MIHIVTYDLTTPNDTSEDYERIHTAIKSLFPNWCHIEQSVWLIDTQVDAAGVRDTLTEYLHSTDVLFVAKLTGTWASRNLGTQRSTWMKGRTF
jgi:hypothetical protein